MKQLLLLVTSSTLAFTCIGQVQVIKEELSVEFNENIATYSIVERIVAAHLGRLFYIDGKSSLEYLPMADAASVEMGRYDNSRIIQETLDYLKIVGQQQDLTYHALLRSRPFPQKGYIYSFEGLGTDSLKLAAVKAYVENIRQFYIERNLKSFFLKTSYFIQGAIGEVKKSLPPSYVNEMEKYYGENISSFKFYVNPFDVVPYDTDFWHGNGPKIKTGSGWIATMISSAYLPLKRETSINNYKRFGFDHPSTINLLVTHEFGHSFVNPALELYYEKINKSDSLLSSYSGLKEKMDNQGYGYWPVSVTEHLVRLGEIRIAETNGNFKKAEDLRKLHVGKFFFVLIPDFEAKIRKYESNRQKYKAYKDFVPELLSVLESISVDTVRTRLGLPIEKFRVSINLKVPEATGAIYITGNQLSLGNWEPKKVRMMETSDSTRRVTFETYPDLKFKITKGSWESETPVEGYEKGKDIQIAIKKDSTLNFEIDALRK